MVGEQKLGITTSQFSSPQVDTRRRDAGWRYSTCITQTISLLFCFCFTIQCFIYGLPKSRVCRHPISSRMFLENHDMSQQWLCLSYAYPRDFYILNKHCRANLLHEEICFRSRTLKDGGDFVLVDHHSQTRCNWRYIFKLMFFGFSVLIHIVFLPVPCETTDTLASYRAYLKFTFARFT